MTDIRKAMKSYLHHYFEVNLREVVVTIPQIPIQLRNKVRVSGAELNGVLFYVVETDGDSLFQPEGQLLLKKLRDRLTDYPCLFISESLSLVAVNHLVEAKLAFIVPGERAYLPQFMFHEALPAKSASRFTTPPKLGILPANIVARYLEGHIGQIFKTSDLKLELSTSAVSRSIKELESAGLVSIHKVGRSNQIRFLRPRAELWAMKDEMLPKLASTSISVPRGFFKSREIFAGESALSLYTLMGKPQRDCFALYFESSERYALAITPTTLNGAAMSHIKKIGAILGYPGNWIEDIDWVEETVEVQLFPYPPSISVLRGKEVISPIMLMLSGEYRRDPRIQNSYSELSKHIYTQLNELDVLDFEYS